MMPKLKIPCCNLFLLERPRINAEQALLPRAAVPSSISEDLSYFSFYSCRLENSDSVVLSTQVNAVVEFKLQLR